MPEPVTDIEINALFRHYNETIASLQTEVQRLTAELECYEAMKEGVGIRIDDLVAENAELRATLAARRPPRIPDDSSEM